MEKFFRGLWHGIKGVWFGLFYETTPENTKKFSLGRVFLITLFVSSMILWMSTKEIPNTMLTVLLTFIGYTFGTKALSSIEKIIKPK